MGIRDRVGGGLLGTSVYAASKGGVNSLIKAVAKEGGPYNAVSYTHLGSRV